MFLKKLFSKKAALTLSLFLIGGLHTMIFAFFEFPSNFLFGEEAETFSLYCKIVLYGCAILVSFSHQFLCRNLGLKKTLIIGLLFNFFGLLTLWINQIIGGLVVLLFLDMFFFGFALTSVINSLVTFIVITFPNRTGVAIIALFAIFNGGVMLAPLLLGLFKGLHITHAIFPCLMTFIIVAIWYIQNKLFDPPYPRHLQHLRNGTLIWRELHYRLALFFLAIICYGIVENSFNLWGFVVIEQTLGESVANETISLFWLFMIVGQILLMVPLYLYSTQKVFYPLIGLVITALYFLFHQHKLFGFFAGLAAGGIGCSAIFPILLSMMEKELIHIARGSHVLPYIETAVSVLMAGYFVGTGTIDLWLEIQKVQGHPPAYHYLVSIIAISITGVVAFLLDITSSRKGTTTL